MIKSNVAAPPVKGGVDITREERWVQYSFVLRPCARSSLAVRNFAPFHIASEEHTRPRTKARYNTGDGR